MVSFCCNRLPKVEENEVKVIPILGDGNCLAHALSVGMGNPSDDYMAVREGIAKELEEQASFYRDFSLYEDERKYLIRKALTDREWMSIEMIFLFCNAVALHAMTYEDKRPPAGNAMLFLPFRNSFVLKTVNIIDICWSDPDGAYHFVALDNINRVPDQIYYVNNARSRGLLSSIFDKDWQKVQKYKVPVPPVTGPKLWYVENADGALEAYESVAVACGIVDLNFEVNAW